MAIPQNLNKLSIKYISQLIFENRFKIINIIQSKKEKEFSLLNRLRL